ncbi:alcohol dehydrogenase [Mycobacterium colombiense]|uniref:NDMA-dependent alcohol dehydrogenase n=1 Tax=Mycobacterium colombiense TaxID=339268 RepID=UPI0007EFBCB3|nr:NDMA-dependent alcohol dehydrogenase [Mycobacterium colombiense]OBK68941.1 alcohol dehydrogenase [Mycobacterium colombiense]
MRTRAAVLWNVGERWSVEDVELDPPKFGEVLVEIAAAGLCHTDEHTVTGDQPVALPTVGGHEGAGVVLEVGPGVSSVDVGDHVAMSFVPACGRCASCVNGLQNLCDLGVHIPVGRSLTDGGFRAHARGQDIGLSCMLGAFANHTVVNEASIVKIDRDIPLDLACLVSCGVATGWGSAVNAGKVQTGETAVVVGVGGIGMNAVQGARAAGAANVVAVEPVAWKRERSRAFGATHLAESLSAAMPLVAEITNGRLADVAIIATGVATSDLLSPTVNLVGKRGRVIVTAVAPFTQTSVDLNLIELTFWEKTVQGCIFGSSSPRHAIPTLLQAYRGGDLKLDELVSKRYRLDEINAGYEDMRTGKNIRGIIVMDHTN